MSIEFDGLNIHRVIIWVFELAAIAGMLLYHISVVGKP